ncbi:MAG: carboxypeptidase regulatory-like domain-containing protein, partial [Gemmatimonadaceae bacterium]
MIRSNINLHRLYGASLIALAMVCTISAGLVGQTTSSNIRGYVTGANGAPVSDAQVVARMAATNETRGTTTNAAGFYYLGGLRPGTYEISIRRVGVQPQTRPVTLRIAETLDLNVSTTDVAAQLATVEVTSARTGTTTKTSEVGTNITREQISNLPNFERNVLDLAKLTPGMSAQQVNSTDKVLASGGQPPEAVNIFVDGASYKNDVLRGGVVGQDASKGNPLPQGAIDQFRVLTQNYKAEYQKAASVVIVATTKSGTNNTEADLFAYGIGKAYVAKDAITARRGGARPNYQRLQAGGNVG